METDSDNTNSAENSRRRSREQRGSNDPATWDRGHADPRRGGRRGASLLDEGPAGPERSDGYRDRDDGYRYQQGDDRYRDGERSGGYPGPAGNDGYRGPERGGDYRGPQRSDYRDREQGDGYRGPQREDRYPEQDRSGGYPGPAGNDGYRRPERGDSYRGRHSPPAPAAGGQRPAGGPWPGGRPARADGARPNDSRPYRREDAPVARRTPTGWRVGDEEVSDLTSAMVLADLLAADLPPEGPPTPGGAAAAAAALRRHEVEPQPDVRQLQETVAQLEHALTVRVRVEQAIGVLAERHRLRPRQAFELLRSAARARGRRVLEVAGEVVDSASNPLMRIPEELAKPPAVRRRGRMSRRPQASE
ncbi:MAG TPA: ANTAR domain-containing protein [Streptosporangiaceae bacterium]|nr:ANTAR domain-containing protein [Streptosporangiaceae bacterium]